MVDVVTWKVNLSVEQAVKAHRAVRIRDSHIFYTSGSQLLWDRGPVNSSFTKRGPGIIDARVRYRAAARRLRNTVLDNRHKGGGKDVSLTHQAPFKPQEDFWYSFLLEAESKPGP
jgi:hypothetical protein